MSRSDPAPAFTCASCRGPIPGRPTIHVGVAFCCAGCVAGGPCICSYDLEDPDDDRAATGLRAGDQLHPHDVRSLAVLTDVLARAVVVDEHGVACVGRRVRVREEDGGVATHALVIPGDGDAFHAWLSIEAPMGAALVGARAGDRVQVQAPAGVRWLEVLEVR